MDKTLKISTNEYSELNRLILDVAVRGKMDCLGPVDISWNVIKLKNQGKQWEIQFADKNK